MTATSRGQLRAQDALLSRPADEERWQTQGGHAGSTGRVACLRGDVVHVCLIALVSRSEIVPIRRGDCMDGPQRQDNATRDVHVVVRAAISAKNRLPLVSQKFNTFNTFGSNRSSPAVARQFPRSIADSRWPMALITPPDRSAAAADPARTGTTSSSGLAAASRPAPG
jgi:hypothetical protein